jgi:hypothetical protein
MINFGKYYNLPLAAYLLRFAIILANSKAGRATKRG